MRIIQPWRGRKWSLEIWKHISPRSRHQFLTHFLTTNVQRRVKEPRRECTMGSPRTPPRRLTIRKQRLFFLFCIHHADNDVSMGRFGFKAFPLNSSPSFDGQVLPEGLDAVANTTLTSKSICWNTQSFIICCSCTGGIAELILNWPYHAKLLATFTVVVLWLALIRRWPTSSCPRGD